MSNIRELLEEELQIKDHLYEFRFELYSHNRTKNKYITHLLKNGATIEQLVQQNNKDLDYTQSQIIKLRRLLKN